MTPGRGNYPFAPGPGRRPPAADRIPAGTSSVRATGEDGEVLFWLIKTGRARDVPEAVQQVFAAGIDRLRDSMEEKESREVPP